jgi:hypothetical protein
LNAPASAIRRDHPAISTLLPALVVAVTALVAAAPPVSAATPHVVLDRPRVGEYQPVRGDGWIAWQQNSRKRPGHYDVFVRPVDGGSRVKVNIPGTNGANGDIEGDVLVYQQFEKRRSGLRFFDLTTHQRTVPPSGVNTEQWEYWPSTSGRWLLFGRLQHNGTRRIILFDLSNGDAKNLAKIRGKDAFLAPGQVSGDWVVWYRCPADSSCNVIRYQISTGESEIIANPHEAQQHSPSVGTGGTVYYARGRGRCGNRVTLMRQPLEGEAEELWRLPNGDDIGRTHAQMRPRGTTILFDHFSCGQPAESDGWQITP